MKLAPHQAVVPFDSMGFSDRMRLAHGSRYVTRGGVLFGIVSKPYARRLLGKRYLRIQKAFRATTSRTASN